MLKLAGDATPRRRSAREIFALETRLARAHWTNVESRDAVKTYNKRRARRSAEGVSRASTGRRGRRELGIAQAPALVVFAAKLSSRRLPPRSTSCRSTLEAVPARVAPQRLRAVSEQGVRRRRVRVLRTDAARRQGKAAALEARRQHDQRQPRRDARQAVCRAHFKPEAKARMEQLVENLREAFREGIDKLEWMSPETKKEAQEKLAKFRPKIGYPNKWRDYSRVRDREGRPRRQRHARVHRRERIPARQGRQADRPRAVGHDAADGQRVLQPGAQRDRLPRRDSAAAVLQSRGRRRGELRRHWRA